MTHLITYQGIACGYLPVKVDESFSATFNPSYATCPQCVQQDAVRSLDLQPLEIQLPRKDVKWLLTLLEGSVTSKTEQYSNIVSALRGALL